MTLDEASPLTAAHERERADYADEARYENERNAALIDANNLLLDIDRRHESFGTDPAAIERAAWLRRVRARLYDRRVVVWPFMP